MRQRECGEERQTGKSKGETAGRREERKGREIDREEPGRDDRQRKRRDKEGETQR